MAKKNLLDLIESQAATLADSSASISSSFRSTESVSEVNEALQHQIQELETEVINLRIATDGDRDKEFLEKQIQELTAKLSQISGEHEIEIELLDPDPDQPRSIFPQHLIEERAESLRRNEQISPIIVIPQPNGRYRIFDGALRKLAAPRAGKTTLRAVFLPHHEMLDGSSQFEKQFVTGKDTEKLHYLDLANGLIRIICNRYPYLKSQQSEIPNILNNALYQLKKTGGFAELNKIRNASTTQQREWLKAVEFTSAEACNVLEVILDRQFNPASVASNIFPILALSDDLKAVIQETGLEASKAKAINKLTVEVLRVDEKTAIKIRTELAYLIAQEEKSLDETNQLIRQTIQRYNPVVPKPNIKAEKSIKQIKNLNFDGLDRLQLKDIRATFRERLKELDLRIKASQSGLEESIEK